MKKILCILLVFLLSGCGALSVSPQTAWDDSAVTAFDSLTVIPSGEWKTYARQNKINPRNGKCKNPVMVLGHYPEYVELTAKLKAESMQIPMEDWNEMTPQEQWDTTAGYLDRAADRGFVFRLATPLERVRPESFYLREVGYVLGKGYRISPDGLWLVR